MLLFKKDQREKLIANGVATAAAQATGKTEPDHVPVVKLFTPWAGATWLLSEVVYGESDIAFGLCDLGQGYPELGYVSIHELTTIKGPGGLKVERDRYFTPDKTISAYATEARKNGRITA